MGASCFFMLSVVLPRQHQGQENVVLEGKGIQQVEILEHKAQVGPAEGRQVPLPYIGQGSCRPDSTSPPVGLSRAARILSSVVLPEPDSPMMATYSPASTEKFTFGRACTWLPPKRVV